jgi:hypothetical protein
VGHKEGGQWGKKGGHCRAVWMRLASAAWIKIGAINSYSILM